MTTSVIPVNDAREAPSLPFIPQTGGRRQTSMQEGGVRGARRGNFNAYALQHTHIGYIYTKNMKSYIT